MIFPIAPDVEILMMDDTDYREHMILNSLEEENNKQPESVSSLMEEDEMDDSEFLDAEKVGIVTPSPKKHSKTEQDSEPAQVGIPSKFDILCGQSRICASHTGNRRFQVVLDIYAPKYDAASNKQEKMALTKEIVACIDSAGGRFLKYKDGLWQEITTVTARDKVSHALRTKVASWKKQQQQQKEQREENPDSSPAKKRPTHRRKSKGRRQSSSSITTSASDIVTTSFDANDSASSAVMDELLKSQREFFAQLTQNSEEKKIHPLEK